MSWSKYIQPMPHRCEFPDRPFGSDARPVDKQRKPFNVDDHIICDVCGQTYKLKRYPSNYRDPEVWIWEAGKKVDFE